MNEGHGAITLQIKIGTRVLYWSRDALQCDDAQEQFAQKLQVIVGRNNFLRYLSNVCDRPVSLYYTFQSLNLPCADFGSNGSLGRKSSPR